MQHVKFNACMHGKLASSLSLTHTHMCVSWGTRLTRLVKKTSTDDFVFSFTRYTEDQCRVMIDQNLLIGRMQRHVSQKLFWSCYHNESNLCSNGNITLFIRVFIWDLTKARNWGFIHVYFWRVFNLFYNSFY